MCAFIDRKRPLFKHWLRERKRERESRFREQTEQNKTRKKGELSCCLCCLYKKFAEGGVKCPWVVFRKLIPAT